MEQNFNNNSTENKKSLREDLLSVIDEYFKLMGQNSNKQNLSEITVLSDVEAAMYEGVMKFTKGNQSKAAKMLGVSRGTLRTKLMQYFNTTHVGGVYKI